MLLFPFFGVGRGVEQDAFQFHLFGLHVVVIVSGLRPQLVQQGVPLLRHLFVH